jgi:hypothetical protein
MSSENSSLSLLWSREESPNSLSKIGIDTHSSEMRACYHRHLLTQRLPLVPKIMLLFGALIHLAFFFFLAVLGFELRALCSLGRCYTVWVLPPALPVLFALEIGSCFLCMLAWTVMLPALAEMAGMHHQASHPANIKNLQGTRQRGHRTFLG